MLEIVTGKSNGVKIFLDDDDDVLQLIKRSEYKVVD